MSSAPKDVVTGTDRPVPLAEVLGLHPYVQGKSQLEATAEPIKLSSNECAIGPSPMGVAAYEGISEQLHRYADGSQQALREAIARVHGLDAGRIVCGNGSEELIGLLTRSYVGHGDELLLSQNHFVMCSIYGEAQGATIVLAPERDDRIDVDAMLERVTSKTKMLAIANPNNPTGTYLSIDEIDRLADGVPANVVVLIDGAYAEYVQQDDFDAGARWAETRPNVVMTRTFSKIFGLAGLRIGWAYAASDIIEIMNRLRTPFNASLPAMAAAAAAIADQEHVERARTHNTRSMQQILGELRRLGLRVTESVANFYLIDFESPARAGDAVAFLESNGIIPRPAGGSGQLRITVGTDDENEAVLAALRTFLSS